MRKNILVCIFALAFAKNHAQTEKKIYSIIDAAAQKVAEESKAYSVSVGILKDGKVYTRHFGELDKGKEIKPTMILISPSLPLPSFLQASCWPRQFWKGK